MDVLLFGPAGAGKTSLIKTFYRALHERCSFPPRIEQELSIKDRHSNEGTTRFTKVVVQPDLEGPTGEESKASQIVLHDTRGQIWMDEREQAQLNLIMQGKVADKSLVEQRNYRYAYMLWEFWKRDTELFPNRII